MQISINTEVLKFEIPATTDGDVGRFPLYNIARDYFISNGFMTLEMGYGYRTASIWERDGAQHNYVVDSITSRHFENWNNFKSTPKFSAYLIKV